MPTDAELERLAERIRVSTNERYEFQEWIGAGSTGLIVAVEEQSLNDSRAMKILRSDLPAISHVPDDKEPLARSFEEYFAREVEHLSGITHENVCKIYGQGTISDMVDPLADNPTIQDRPFYVMELVDDGEDLDRYLERFLPHHIDRDLILSVIVGIVRGVAAIHDNNARHGDIKPENVLVSPEGDVKITDFGFAKSVERGGGSTFWVQDRSFLHPELQQRLREQQIKTDSEDSRRTVIRIGTDELASRSLQWELHALGRTIDSIVDDVRAVEERADILRSDDFEFLSHMVSRLVDDRRDGWVGGRRHDSYTSTQVVAHDVSKLAKKTDLHGEALEYRPVYRRGIDIPMCGRVPLTSRMEALIDHPLFQRLHTVPQLGVVSRVYRGAKHSRFEHSLGVVWHGIQYAHALWNARGGYFRQVVHRKDIHSFLVALTLHDLGQYPFAHAFEESDVSEKRLYDHERLTRRLISARHPDDIAQSQYDLFGSDDIRDDVNSLLRDRHGRYISDIIEGNGVDEWGVDLDEVAYLLGDEEVIRDPRPGLQILRTVIDGPLDADKTDYLRRDALHLDMNLGVDLDVILRHMCVVGWNEPAGNDADLRIGLREHGKGVAHDLHNARFKMFERVYWHRVARSAERMLRYSVDRLRSHLGNSFRREFFSRVLVSSDEELISRLKQVAERESARASGRSALELEGCVRLLDAVRKRHLHREALKLDASKSEDRKLHQDLSYFWERALNDVGAYEEFFAFSDGFRERLNKEGGDMEVRPGDVLVDIPNPRTDRPSKYRVPIRLESGQASNISELEPSEWENFARRFRNQARQIRVFLRPELERALSKEVVKGVLSEAVEGIDRGLKTEPPRAG